MAHKGKGPQDWVHARDVVQTLLDRLPVGRILRQYAVWRLWEDAVGKTVAAQAWPSKIRHGRLFVGVSDAVWLQELQFLKERIKAELNRRLGEPAVKDIFFFLGSGPPSADPGPAAPPRPAPEPFVEIALPPLADERLRAALAALLEARRRRLKPDGGCRQA